MVRQGFDPGILIKEDAIEIKYAGRGGLAVGRKVDLQRRLHGKFVRFHLRILLLRISLSQS